ncbi:MAG: transketolase family protein [Candidatus Karelsulcia muelleri]|uniref:transketolase family protein n=1 Tax=Candidatus Karelsulcia muelleri TaxID=336810 RepID=UPI000D7BCEEF|nr:transketolase C-terminal domain-containing protein [Candidatus Karelsulcia muelleri]
MKLYKNIGMRETRSGFGDALLKLGKENTKIVALCADLTNSLSMTKFSKLFPYRFFQIGISEANMMGIAAGLTIGNYIPFTGTFANFATARVYDQIRQSIVYSKKNVKICASHSGISLGEDGATHQSLEDIGMMKMLPGLVVINTCDYNQTYAATIAISKYIGPVYLRFGRPAVPNFTSEKKLFKIGKAIILNRGEDVTIVSTGHLVWESLEAAKFLKKEGISCEVINIHTIKPLDEESILKSVKKTKCIITAEEHNYWGGLGESVARLLSLNYPCSQEIVAVNDTFGESGKPFELMKKYSLDKETIIKKVKKVIKKKKLLKY